MPWTKRGRIFVPAGEGGWIRRRAQLPTVLVRHDCLRIYFASLDERGHALPVFLDVDRTDPSRILRLECRPLLGLGEEGSFEESGVMPSCAVKDRDRVLLYTIGWSRGRHTPYELNPGVAESLDGGETFRRIAHEPLLARSADEPFLATSPWVLKEAGAWRMWYTSGTGWIDVHGRLEPLYTVKHAWSTDGISWTRGSGACITPSHPEEAVGRPTLVFSEGRYRMWFCHRGSRDYRGGTGSYRIGYAESRDGLHWTRNDAQSGIEVSVSGWDNSMIEYPCVVEVGSRLLLFYNGNGFGESGFGWAEWENQS